ncbi:transposase [Streptomyces sp. NBC_00353]|uniref:transposase n=1 Tax=Streptomyces sp. NBC_00353 TaxID=2975722 RepID=UPI003FA6B720
MNALDFSRAAEDDFRSRALRGLQDGTKSCWPGQSGSKHLLITDATGIPLAVTLTGGNRKNVTQFIPLLEAVPAVRGKRCRPRRRADVVLGDRGYDHDTYCRLVRALGVKPVIAPTSWMLRPRPRHHPPKQHAQPVRQQPLNQIRHTRPNNGSHRSRHKQRRR